MELEDIHPIAVVAGIVGAGIGWFMTMRIDELGIIWKLLTPIFSAIGGFFIMQKMASG